MHAEQAELGTHPDDGRGAIVLRPFSISLGATAVFTAIVLVCAGRVGIWQAWVYAGLSVSLNVGQRILLRSHPELAKERARVPDDARPFDKALLGLGLLLTLTMLATAGLQFRALGGPSLSTSWFVVGLLLQFAGEVFFLWALRENRFFTAGVRVQRDRGHAVCTTGPYRFVRHPGNLGMILGTLGFPLLFQSTWSFVPAGVSIILLVARTHLEDLLLTNELAGYRDYRTQTRFRLVPGIW